MESVLVSTLSTNIRRSKDIRTRKREKLHFNEVMKDETHIVFRDALELGWPLGVALP